MSEKQEEEIQEDAEEEHEEMEEEGITFTGDEMITIKSEWGEKEIPYIREKKADFKKWLNSLKDVQEIDGIPLETARGILLGFSFRKSLIPYPLLKVFFKAFNMSVAPINYLSNRKTVKRHISKPTHKWAFLQAIRSLEKTRYEENPIDYEKEELMKSLMEDVTGRIEAERDEAIVYCRCEYKIEKPYKNKQYALTKTIHTKSNNETKKRENEIQHKKLLNFELIKEKDKIPYIKTTFYDESMSQHIDYKITVESMLKKRYRKFLGMIDNQVLGQQFRKFLENINSMCFGVSQGGTRIVPFKFPHMTFLDDDDEPIIMAYTDMVDYLENNPEKIPDYNAEIDVKTYLKFYNLIQIKKWDLFVDFIDEFFSDYSSRVMTLPLPSTDKIRRYIKEDVTVETERKFKDLLEKVQDKMQKSQSEDNRNVNWEREIKKFHIEKEEIERVAKDYENNFKIAVDVNLKSFSKMTKEIKTEAEKVDFGNNRLKGLFKKFLVQ